MEGRGAIVDFLRAVAPRSENWALKGRPQVVDGVTESWLSFETPLLRCVGHVRLNSQGRCWTLTTVAQELKDHPEASGAQRPEGRPYGSMRGRVPLSTRLDFFTDFMKSKAGGRRTRSFRPSTAALCPLDPFGFW